MAASHFFVGLGAGVALLTVPVLVLAPGVPGRVAAWIEGPPPSVAQVEAPAAASRPVRGFVPGETTPGPEAPPPTLVPKVKPTTIPRPTTAPMPTPSSMLRTGVIHSGGVPVPVRRAAGIDSADDPVLADGSPVLVSAGSELTIGGERWRAVRGLGGVAGWGPRS